VFTTACAADGEWTVARIGIERTLAVYGGASEPPPVLQMEYARILNETGDAGGARSILESLVAGSDLAVSRAAREQLESMGP
jgi:hypothetical protein